MGHCNETHFTLRAPQRPSRAFTRDALHAVRNILLIHNVRIITPDTRTHTRALSLALLRARGISRPHDLIIACTRRESNRSEGLKRRGPRRQEPLSRTIKVHRWNGTKDLRTVAESLRLFLTGPRFIFIECAERALYIPLSVIADITLPFTVRTIKLASTSELMPPPPPTPLFGAYVLHYLETRDWHGICNERATRPRIAAKGAGKKG